MFWRKKSASSVDRTVSNAPTQPVEPPKPILRMNTEGQGAANIRFAGQGSTYKPPTPTSATFAPDAAQACNPMPRMGQPQTAVPTERVRVHPTAPRVIVSSYDSYSPPTHPHQRMASFDSSPLNAQPRVTASSRRSSRPTSPSATSFGARIRSRTEPLPTIASSSAPMVSVPLETPPMPSSHVTTPPTAYVSTFQSRAPPPPSPYRPTNERRRSSLTRNLPEQLPMMGDFAPAASNFLSSDSRSSVHTLPGADVPMLNIIPATPIDQGNEFPGAWEGDNVDRRPAPVGSGSLEEAVQLEMMVQVPLEGVPSIDVQLDFSPFEPLAELPDTDTPMHEVTEYFRHDDVIVNEDEDDMEEYDMDSIDHEHAPSEPLPPSPPFASYPSLPSLASHESLRSSASMDSMPTSSSMSSLVSFPDVEEALGSMLASLSDSSMASTAIQTPTKGQSMAAFEGNPGLGLGLDLPDQACITAPLSPRRRAPPPPLDLSATKFNSAVEQGVAHSAPIINHRIAFYTTAKAHPNSPSSGIFTSSSSLASSASSSSTISLGDTATPAGSHHTYRDSISLASEASDEDLCTASIISLTPIMKGKIGAREMKEEILGEGEEYSNGLGLGLGLETTMRNGSGFGQSVLCGLEEDVAVGLAL
ncbi:hypothetical protein IAT40_002307 [Kwoniella sp. CBS 6097]